MSTSATNTEAGTVSATLAEGVSRSPAGYGPEAVAGDDLGGGRYRLLEMIGAGSSGSVWRAEDTQLGRFVAIKRLHHQSERARDRLRREARAIAGLDHPNVVRVFDLALDGPRPYVVMELLRGSTIAKHVQRLEPSDWRTVVELYRQAGAGLQAAHDIGIVHRDFKPTNVMVTDDGEVKVLDFGIATVRPTGDTETDSSSTAGATRIAGTPAYMAPEQHRGDRADTAADVFAFGASLYEGLYRVRAFPGQGLAELDAQKRAGPPERLATHVPRSIHRVVARALEPEPEHRWPSVGELLDALRSRRRSRVSWLASLGVVAAIGVFAWDEEPEPQPCLVAADSLRLAWHENRAGLERGMARAGLSARRTEDVVAGLDSYAERWSARYRGTCGQTEPSADRYRACLLRLRAAFPTDVDEHLAGRLADQLSPLARCDAEATDEAIYSSDREVVALQAYAEKTSARLRAEIIPDYAELEEAVARARQLGHGPTKAYLLQLVALARTTHETGDVVSWLEEAYAFAHASRDDYRAFSVAVSALDQLAVHHELGPALDTWEGYADALHRQGEVDPLLESRYLTAKGLVWMQRGDTQRAEDALRRAIELASEGSAAWVAAQRRWGRLMYETKRYAEAVVAYTAVVEARREAMVPNRLLCGDLANLATALDGAEQTREALELWEEVLRRTEGEPAEIVLHYRLNAANTMLAQPELRERARALLESVVDGATDEFQRLSAARGLALALDQDGRHAEALAAYREVLKEGRRQGITDALIEGLEESVTQLERKLAGDGRGEEGAPRPTPP